MDNLQKAREAINKIDSEMAKLFEERMEAVKLVAEVKRAEGLPVLNASREKEVINRNLELVSNPDIKDYYVNFIKETMALSRDYQRRLISGMRVAYSGVKGAFAYIAASKVFPDGELVSYSGFKEAYKAVENGECDCAVLPIENSYAGDVAQVMDLSFFGSLYINGVYDLEITQNLLGVNGAKVEDIKTVVSHIQALDQCAEYITEMGFNKIEASNTAEAAKEVANNGDKSVAAIASEETAKLYGLQILERSINKSSKNTTRFAVFSRTRNKTAEDKHLIMFFRVKNEPGSLSKAVSVIGENGVNMQALKSRPTKDHSFKYYFYVEGIGDITDENLKKLEQDLTSVCSDLKVVGTYEKEEKI